MKKLFESWRRFVKEGNVVHGPGSWGELGTDIEPDAKQRALNCLENFIEGAEDADWIPDPKLSPEADDAAFKEFVTGQMEMLLSIAGNKYNSLSFEQALSKMGLHDVVEDYENYDSRKGISGMQKYLDTKECYNTIKNILTNEQDVL